MIYIQSQHPSKRTQLRARADTHTHTYIYISYVQALLGPIYIYLDTPLSRQHVHCDRSSIPRLPMQRCHWGVCYHPPSGRVRSLDLVREMSFCSRYHPRRTFNEHGGYLCLILNLHKNGRMAMQHDCHHYALPSSTW
ncbi:hypothetical protein BO85DRAFT_209313 [Aspergillus piperis CBS 112811]|uniref:Uncharacterized protein n=1 Tax=Aspergillus piperis CBS 112811 TaxID=1448313 RepID=A0A8G1QRB8_9EURO|nr:hypothetical protein BO85DRAFT_209313 [Aspergillus piperis CBS 112811]RAH52194.1 hypothetical protein BO85DRAFT_209313 [Aspergillus piperis CBS 112811]